MGQVLLQDGRKLTLKPQQALDVWRVLSGELEPTPEQEKFALQVKKVYLSWRKAPEDYIKENLEIVIPMALGDWIVNQDGDYIKPQDDFGWKFARRWGMWNEGKPTSLVTKHNRKKLNIADPFVTPVPYKN